MAKKIYDTTKLDTSSRKLGIQRAKNDWKRFLQSLSDICDVDIFLNFHIDEPETKSEIRDIMVCIKSTLF